MHRLRALAAAVLLLLLPSWPSAADPHLSSDPRVNAARTLIESGRFSEALDALRPLAPAHPDRTDVLFLVGLAAMEASRQAGAGEAERAALLDESIAALRTILIDRPGLVRVRLELARAFFLKREDDLSREHFELVLAGEPPPAMVANIRRFLDAMRARRRWSGYFGVTLAPDSNINAASDSDVLFVRGLPFRRDADAGARSGVGAVFVGGGEHRHPLGRRMRLRMGADLARREYAGSDFDQTFVSGHVGPSWQVNRETEASLLASARRTWSAGKPESHGLGARFEGEHRFSRRLTGRARASWHRRAYRRDDGLLDGPALDVSLGVEWLAMPTVRLDATLGHARERPRQVVWRNATRRARAGVSVALPLGFTVGAAGELRWTRYEGRWSPFTPGGATRKDRTRVLRVSAFNRGFTLYGFSPQLVLVNEVRESNAQLYDYKRNRVELHFVRQF